MGNTNTKEARDVASPRSPHDPRFPQQQDSAGQSSSSRHRSRTSRSDLGSLLGISQASSSSAQPPYERRETKQEREARRLEKERQARVIERERSLKEEHVDGGYLVTLGTYVGPEDYSKPTVRQLQIERKIAPFWRGLNDFSETWTEHQIVAVARGLPLPAADAPPPEELIPRPMSADPASTSSQNLNSLTIPMGDRTQSAASDRSRSGLGSAIPSPSSMIRNSSPFKHRPKAIAAALSISSRNGSATEISPREIKLAHDPFVNGQPLEVFLYKDAAECPICFLYYPPYLNHTRCCDQPICSECFVQIKRADPHYPEGHGEAENPEANPEEQAGLLISEPACCPYCQQPEFGVTYEPPPFRRGLAYSHSGPNLGVGVSGTAMSSSSSLSSNLSPTSMTYPSTQNRRRTQSLSANAPNVITTDRVRPDWSTKLATQRAHVARRAAAATALHTAAFLMGNSESRGFRIGRLSRRNTGNASAAGPSSGAGDAGAEGGASGGGGESGSASPATMEPGPRGSSGRGILGGNRRSRMEDLEEMMFAEAIRLSLAAEEERKRKAEKEERKEAKRREKEEKKEEKKAAKAAAKAGASGPYAGSPGGSGHSSLSGSSLSLPSLGLGRRRGNSAASNLRVEASVASAMAATAIASPSVSSIALTGDKDKGKGVERSPPSSATKEPSTEGEPSSTSGSSSSAAQPVPSPSHRPAGPSHLRQMSSASSIASSSLSDTAAGSHGAQSHMHDPRASGQSLGSQSNASDDAGGQGVDRGDPGSSTEPMLNFTSLAEMVGVQLEGEHAGNRPSATGCDAPSGERSAAHASDSAKEEAEEQDVEDATGPAKTLSTGPGQNGGSRAPSPAPINTAQISPPPELVVTPGTPAVVEDGIEGSKQLGVTEVVHNSS
ncbi:C2H2 zinc finger protein [Magnaporthiopsis poae ATCC 64411]|uniref:C2H2 zinc finger protein n=1 Tax=Magnaporthiopsis poae (strain ATCC 64411 / 73-15) TaxID=644358 RepID=A0A0C4DMZ1_MAGP6|nr:C2H2 zinc finger protein [Magnaporthiopsis poae ATCC 64411]